MKTLVFLGIVLVAACAQAKPNQSSQYFFEDFANITDSLLASQENPTNIDTLAAKINALFEVTQYHRVNKRVYQSIFNILGNLRSMSYRVQDSAEIGNLQDSFDIIFDELNLQRDVDEDMLPSKINDLIDEFVNKYVATSVELLYNIFTQTTPLKESAEKIAYESTVLVGTFAENIGKCLLVDLKNEFKEIYQCHQNARGVLPGLAHNTALLNAIASDLEQLKRLHLNGGQTSFNELLVQIGRERYTLMRQIQGIRNQREADKKNKESNRST